MSICLDEASQATDYSAGNLWVGISGIFLVMLAVPGLGLIFESPQAGDGKKPE
jgi:hypothetical protein